ncbi:hypothetical protein PHMEG_00037905 [Phytophthora megakarya]|uniref:Uncharacterized protein n=1 Tax=Phytophthora megakarya TaxID=4795 RepID=A0A225UIX7_9STRA|nr:hypothetical protein PHMEG_00037905 [Phytophthora megakarya]
MPIAERSVSFDASADFSDANVDDEGYLEERSHVAKLPEGVVIYVGHSTGMRSLARNLTKEMEEVAGLEPGNDSDDDGLVGETTSTATGKRTSRPSDIRPPINGDTPAPNKVLGRTLELMRTRAQTVRQAMWMKPGAELVVPIDSTSTRQVAQDSVLLHRAMGCGPQNFPSEAALNDWTASNAGTVLLTWNKKLRVSYYIE